MGAMGSAALMGASGLMTVIYAITKINYSYEIPLLILTHAARRAGRSSQAPHLERPLSAARARRDQPSLHDRRQGGDIPMISRAYHHSRTFSRPVVVALTRDLLK